MNDEKNNKWKKRDGVVYSTDNSFDFQYRKEGEEAETLPAAQQKLRVQLDTHGRAGKTMTLVTGFVGSLADLEILAKKLKTRVGTGGSAKDGQILIQGDVRDKLMEILTKEGYKVRR
jgi:translation initiation factor 1